MFKKDVWRAGAVDVLVETNGIRSLHHGFIADMDPEHLVIDFGFPGHRSDVIPFSKCRDRGYTDSIFVGNKVRALSQRSADQPWRWYPAKLLAYERQEFAFVEMEVDGVLVRDVLPTDRVENAVELENFQSEMRTYYKYSVELPNDQELISLTERPRFGIWWNREADTIAVKRIAGTLSYLTVNETMLSTTQCTSFLHAVRGLLIGPDEWKPAKRPFQAAFPHGKKRSKSEVLMPMALPPANIQGFTIADVLPEVVLEILSDIDITNQQRCRRVCRTWNHLLTSPVVIKIDIDNLPMRSPAVFGSGCQRENVHIPLSLCKTAGPATKVLIITGQYFGKWQYAPFRSVTAMLKAMNVFVPMIVINRRTIWASDLLEYSDPLRVYLRPEWLDVCGKLALINVDVRALVESQDRLPVVPGFPVIFKCDRLLENSFGVKLKPANIVLDAMNTKSLLDALDGLCPEMSNQDLRSMETELAKRLPQSDELVLQVLRKWQLDDPLLAPEQNGSFKCPKLTSLRKITLYALQYRLRPRPTGGVQVNGMNFQLPF
ncbi:uncharacterized protein LOC129592012 [Paramacrobiotus metropolitanus]|uniref:uncharacterized protein LOC129592012 n=1 Tax=Paramacrobiotus metropolitanus TaxID=2943436 RepID=UPI002445CC4F|nr:uncharacterized protein LOC129592012 [Paramacrobiotus metropolitanus]